MRENRRIAVVVVSAAGGRADLGSAAIRNARRETLANGFVHPFHWAGLALYGSD